MHGRESERPHESVISLSYMGETRGDITYIHGWPMHMAGRCITLITYGFIIHVLCVVSQATPAIVPQTSEQLRCVRPMQQQGGRGSRVAAGRQGECRMAGSVAGWQGGRVAGWQIEVAGWQQNGRVTAVWPAGGVAVWQQGEWRGCSVARAA